MELVVQSLSLIVACFIIYTILKFIFNLIFNSSYESRRFPPEPIALPIVGNSYIVKKYSVKYGGLHKGLEELCKQYNTDVLGLKLGGDYVVVLQSSQILEEALSKDELLGRPKTFFVKLRSLGTNKGITMTDGHLWQEQRAFAMKQLYYLGFGKEKMECLIQEEIQSFINKIKDDESNLSLKLAISRCVINVLWALVSGYRFENEELLDELLNLMNERSKAFDMAGGFMSQFPWIRFIAPEACGYNLIQKINKQLKNIVSRTIEEHKRSYSRNKTRDFIDAFLHEMYESKDENTTFTDDQLIMVCLDFFIAGSITTSSALDFLLFRMLLSPDVQQNAYDEISNVIKPGQLTSLSHKDRMPYVQSVLYENERIMPIAPLIGPRRVLKDTTLGGYTILKDTIILLNVTPSSSEENRWENPHAFSPNRFLLNLKEEKKKLFTFGKGKRRCPGEKLAVGFIFLFFTSFLNHFKILNPSEQVPSLNYIPGMVLSPKPYEVRLKPRHKPFSERNGHI